MEKIAVVGISCLFPGATNPEEFFQNLLQKKDTTSKATIEQIGVDPDLFFSPEKGKTDKYYNTRGGFIRDFSWDGMGFNLSPEKVLGLDDIYQWPLYVAREALKDANLLGQTEKLKRAGVLLGNLSFPTKSSNKHYLPFYHQTLGKLAAEKLGIADFDLNNPVGAAEPIDEDNLHISGRPAQIVAEALGLGEINFALDAACASSLYSVKLACDYLQAHKADIMLAGAVSAADPFFVSQGFSTFQAYPTDENSCPLDKNTKGLVAGEGAGMFVLKRLTDAQESGDKIYAVISGIGLSNDGKGKFILSPNPEGQVLSYQNAYKGTDIDPKEIGYIECHATGTPLGDVTELDSLDRFFGKYQAQPKVGSVKSNFGHMLTAAGMASMMKVILSMQKGILPATIHIKDPFSSPNNVITSEQIVQEQEAWPKDVNYAAVNAFGFGGTNAHLVFESPKVAQPNPPPQPPTLEEMAIIGMEAHFGAAKNLKEFKEAIYQGKDLKAKLPESRRQGFGNGEGLTGGFIENFEFDYLRFKIPPNEKDPLIPQQLLMLTVADQAIRQAELKEGGNVAVIIAMETDPTLHRFRGRVDLTWKVKEALENQGIALTNEEEQELEEVLKSSMLNPVGVNQYTSFIGNIMACRIASLWDFKGAAFTLSSEENSTAKALEVAQMLLSNGEADTVLIGAVDLAGSPEEYSLDLNALNADGAGAIILQNLSKADKEKAHIYATLQAPTRFKDTSELDFTGKEYLEINGNPQAASLPNLRSGSIENNLGNARSASSMASLIKSALLLEEKFLPASELGTAASPWLNFEERSLSLLHFGASNYHFELSESEGLIVNNDKPYRQAGYLFILKGTLAVELQSLESSLEEGPDLEALSKNLYGQSLQKGGACCVLLAQDLAELKQEIQGMKAGLNQLEYTSPRGSYYTGNPLTKKGKVAFVYPGGFSSYVGMQKDFFDRFPEFLQLPESYSSNPEGLFYRELIHPVGGDLTEDQQQGNLAANPIAMFESGINASILYSQLLRSFFKIKPDSVYGYSMGEVSMMFGMGCWDITDTISHKLHSMNTFTHRLAGEMEVAKEAWATENPNWQCYQVNAAAVDVKSKLAGKEKIYCLLVNSPSEVILGGNDDALLAFFAETGLEGQKIPMNDIVHCELAKSEFAALKEMHTSRVSTIPDVSFYSGLHYAKTAVSTEQAAENIAGIYGRQLDFSRLTETLYQDGNRIFIEVGPRASCSKWISETLQGKEHLAVSLDRKGKSTGESVMMALAKLIAHGVMVDLNPIFPSLHPSLQPPKRSFIQKIPLGGKPIKEQFKTIGALHPTRTAPKIRQAPPVMKSESTIDPSTIEHVIESPQNNLTIQGETLPGQSFAHLNGEDPLTVLLHFQAQVTKSHLAFLEGRKTSLNELSALIQMKQNLVSGSAAPSNAIPVRPPAALADAPIADVCEDLADKPQKQPPWMSYPPVVREGKQPESIWDEKALLEFADGKIANVFGEDYAIIDTYGPRVRLPLPPYLLVNRITEMKATKGEFKPSTMTTEYDIPKDAWYTSDGQIPWAIAVEAGQCDLVLISYLGIDFECKGNLLYRLLDCTLTFKGEMPKEGDTMRYEISINSFARHGENLLFFFSYDCFVGDQLVHTMTDGCAGFFSEEDLAKGKGVIRSEKEMKERALVAKQSFNPHLRTSKSSFSKEDLLCLSRGQISRCFGANYDQKGLNPALRFSSEEFLMIDQVTDVQSKGGIWGLGTVTALKNLTPDDWYFPCHFKDDSCLAGSLMAEGCVQLLQFYLLHSGLQVKTSDATFRPIKDLDNKVRCRGQVVPTDTQLEYRMEVTEIGLEPTPYAKANVDILLNGKVIVDFTDVGVELEEKQKAPIQTPPPQPKKQALYDEQAVYEFALGSLRTAFGDEFGIYDNRPSQRNPNGDLQLVTRVLEVDGKIHELNKESFLLGEYDAPRDAWYYVQNSYPYMPYSVMMEIALQPCGFIGAVMGSPLVFPDVDLHYRNLDATAHLLQDLDLRGKTITTKAWLHSTSKALNTLIQQYSFELWCEDEKFYEGKTTFGYFTNQALSNQLGLDSGKLILPWKKSSAAVGGTDLDLTNLSTQNELFQSTSSKPYDCLGHGQLDFLEFASVYGQGGKNSLGYVYAGKNIDAGDWFFPMHFHQDSVMPGSLGVEAILQAMKIYALDQKLTAKFQNPHFAHHVGTTSWKYRGQIIPENDLMEVEVHLKEIKEEKGKTILIGDANLWKDGLRIYEVTDCAIEIQEA